MTAGAVCDQTDPYQRAGGMAHSVQPLREAILRGSPSNTHMLYKLNAGKMYRQADCTIPSLMAGGALMGLFYFILFFVCSCMCQKRYENSHTLLAFTSFTHHPG